MEKEAPGQVAASESYADEIELSRSATARAIFGLFGFIALGFGIAGVYLPVMPGTLSLLIAAYFFSMSSERMYRWMMTNRLFGQDLRDYRNGLGIARRVKVVAISSIVLSVGLTVLLAIDNPWGRAGMVLFGLVGIWYIVNQPTREVEEARRAAAARAR